jgi:hypothetical protein
MKLRHLPTRAATGGFILNSGLSKIDADEESTKQLHAAASDAYPFLADMDPKLFVELLSAAELTLGAVLLLPMVRSRLAGAALALFSAGLLGVYLRLPGMTRADGIRPTHDGVGLAKDSWMMGIAMSLLIDGDRAHRKAA